MGESVEVKNQKTRQVLRFNIGFESQFNVVPLFSKYGLWFQESFLLLTNEVTNFFFTNGDRECDQGKGTNTQDN